MKKCINVDQKYLQLLRTELQRHINFNLNKLTFILQMDNSNKNFFESYNQLTCNFIQ